MTYRLAIMNRQLRFSCSKILPLPQTIFNFSVYNFKHGSMMILLLFMYFSSLTIYMSGICNYRCEFGGGQVTGLGDNRSLTLNNTIFAPIIFAKMSYSSIMMLKGLFIVTLTRMIMQFRRWMQTRRPGELCQCTQSEDKPRKPFLVIVSMHIVQLI